MCRKAWYICLNIFNEYLNMSKYVENGLKGG